MNGAGRIILAFACGLLVLTMGNASAQIVSSEELIRDAAQYDGKVIVFAGEVVGEVMSRGQHAWVNIHDGANALGVWMRSEAAREITAGSYKTKGDWLEVTGTFNRACPEHGGDLDIHATAIRKIKPGRVIIERLNLDKKREALVLLGALAAVWILTLLMRR